MAFGALGIGYAMWYDTIHIDVSVNTAEVKLCIPENSWSTTDDNAYVVHSDYQALGTVCSPSPKIGPITLVPSGKDVANIDVALDGCDTMVVTINNAYPYYYNHVGFKVTNEGTIPVKIWKMVLTAGGNEYTYYTDITDIIRCLEMGEGSIVGPDLLVWYGDNFGDQIEPGDSRDFSFEVVVLQPAPQSATMEFSITIYGVQWNEYQKGPIAGY